MPVGSAKAKADAEAKRIKDEQDAKDRAVKAEEEKKRLAADAKRQADGALFRLLASDWKAPSVGYGTHRGH